MAGLQSRHVLRRPAPLEKDALDKSIGVARADFAVLPGQIGERGAPASVAHISTITFSTPLSCALSIAFNPSLSG